MYTRCYYVYVYIGIWIQNKQTYKQINIIKQTQNKQASKQAKKQTNSLSSVLLTGLRTSGRTGSLFSPRPARLCWRSVLDRTGLEQTEPFSTARSDKTGSVRLKSSGRVRRELLKLLPRYRANSRGNIVERACHLMHTCTTRQTLSPLYC